MKSNELNKALLHLSQHDNKLQALIKKHGHCNLQPKRKYFNALLDSIISQQLSVLAARSINKKLYGYFNGTINPEIILNTPHQILRSLGLSNAKVKYVKDLSEKILNKSITFRGINNKTNIQIIELLTTVKGIGIWTAHMFLIFSLVRLDILPVNDFGIRKAVMLNYGFTYLPSVQEVTDIAKINNWSPYETIASWYMWRSLE